MDNPIIVAMDGMTLDEAHEVAEKLDRWVWGFKFNDLFFQHGMELCAHFEQKNIMIDAKFHDIPNTVANVTKKLADWGAKIVTVHASGGREMIQAAVENLPGKVAAVTVLTSIDTKRCINVYHTSVAVAVTNLIEEAKEGGASYVVCSVEELSLAIFQKGVKWRFEGQKIVPGIRPAWYQDDNDDQKRVATPVEAMEKGADYLVMGRPILRADDPVEAAQRTMDEIRKG